MHMRKTKEKEIKVLTDLEKKFAELFVENFFSQDTKTNTEIAKLSGYAPESAYQRGYENTTHKIKPHVVQRIEELKEDFRIRNSIDPDKHMAELNNIKRLAIKKGHLSTAGRMEELRGKVAGYYVDRLLTKQSSDKDQTLEQLEMKLQNLLQEWNVIAPNEELTFGGKKNGKK